MLRPPELDWSNAEVPYCAQYQDGYYSQDNPLRESTEVFIEGNHLPERWRGKHHAHSFCIGEIGFGAGLNFLNTWAHWLRCDNPNLQLHYLACEAHPLSAQQLERALQPWKELRVLSHLLQQQWVEPVPGVQQLRLKHQGRTVRLTLALGDAHEFLSACAKQPRAWIDAWYLDGFAPNHNPDMWSGELMQSLARLSRKGATFSTYSAAGVVQRNLQAAGFATQRVAGYGKKRHRLQGQIEAGGTPVARQRLAWVDGSGLAGSALARALADRGWEVAVAGERTGASLIPALVLYPGLRSSLKAGAAALAGLLYARRELAPWLRGEGVVQLAVDTRSHRQLSQLVRVGLPTELVRWCEADELSDLAGVQLNKPGLWLNGAGWCNGGEVCDQRLQHPEITLLPENAEPSANALRLLCNPWRAEAYNLPLTPRSGSIHAFRATSASRELGVALSGNGYLTPAQDGWHWVGATYEPGSNSPQPEAANRARLSGWSEDIAQSAKLEQCWRGTRFTTSDKLPLVGVVSHLQQQSPEVDAVLLGLGSRGLAFSGLAAEWLACTLNDEPWPITPALAQQLSAMRFNYEKA